MRRFAELLGRLAGLASTGLGVWVLISNLAEVSYSGWTLAWILSAALIGAIGGLTFLLSLDGPLRFRTRWVRLLGWVGMLALALLPWSYWFVMLILVALVFPVALQPIPAGSISPEPSA